MRLTLHNIHMYTTDNYNANFPFMYIKYSFSELMTGKKQ